MRKAGIAICTTIAICWLFAVRASAQVLTDTANGTLSVSIPFANLMPGTSSNPSSVQIQFRIRSNSLTGYKVQASASFSATTNASLDGGTTVDASDIGVGITSIIDGASVITPRGDIIATGLNYNPGSIPSVNGMTPYTGMGSGRATLADIIANPGITILSGPRVATTQSITASGSNFITVTMTFGLLGQFFTPAALSGNLILVISNGP